MSLLHKEYSVEKDDYANAGMASIDIKQTLAQIGIGPDILRRIAICCYEAEINMIIHAWGGVITMDVEEDGEIRFLFKDPGPGIPDIEKAMTPGWSTASEQAREMGFGAGMGLVNIKAEADTFDLQSSPQGTELRISFQAS
jgi:serine/threonine-protein kinase RsbT